MGKENRPFIFCGHSVGEFDLETSLASEMQFQRRKPPDGALSDSGDKSVDIGVVVKEIVEAIDSVIVHANNDEHLASCNEKMDADF